MNLFLRGLFFCCDFFLPRRRTSGGFWLPCRMFLLGSVFWWASDGLGLRMVVDHAGVKKHSV